MRPRSIITILLILAAIFIFLSSQVEFLGVPQITDAEYRQLQMGMDPVQVREIVGRDGELYRENRFGSIDQVVYKYSEKVTNLKQLNYRKFIYLTFEDGKLYRIEKRW